MDVPDILLVIQWRATCKLAALWQRFGRAARDKQLTGTAILFAEKEHFDDERVAKAASASRPVKRAVLSLSNGGAVHDQSETRYGVDTMVNADSNGSSTSQDTQVLLEALARGEDPSS